MTLKHPGRYDSGDEGPFLPAARRTTSISVMSYRDNPDSGELAGHLMLYDIAALQARFGANLQYRTGNDVYGAPGRPARGAVGRRRHRHDRRQRLSPAASRSIFATAASPRSGRRPTSPSPTAPSSRTPPAAAATTSSSATSGPTPSSGGRGQRRARRRQGRRTCSPGGPAADAFVFKRQARQARATTIVDFDTGLDTIRLDRDAFARASAARGRSRPASSMSAPKRTTGATASSTTTRRAS